MITVLSATDCVVILALFPLTDALPASLLQALAAMAKRNLKVADDVGYREFFSLSENLNIDDGGF